MASLVTKTPTSRRQMLGASAALLLATVPAAAKGVSLTYTLSDPDAALLANCAEYGRLDAENKRLMAIIHGDDEEAGEAAYAHCDKFLWDRSYALADIITSAPAKTRGGLAAKGEVLALHLHRHVPEMLMETFEEAADSHELLAMSLARDAMALAGSLS